MERTGGESGRGNGPGAGRWGKAFLILVLLAAPVYAQGRPHFQGKLLLTLPPGQTFDYRRVKVNRVIDGDTIELENLEKVNLIGIDCPENRTSAKARTESRKTGRPLRIVKRDGRKAAKFLKDLIEGREVRLEFDEEREDAAGTLWAYVFMFSCEHCEPDTKPGTDYERLDDGTYLFVNATVVGSGYARPQEVPPNVKYAALFERLYQEAQGQRLGLWKTQKTGPAPSS